jgi:hypothetical protein
MEIIIRFFIQGLFLPLPGIIKYGAGFPGPLCKTPGATGLRILISKKYIIFSPAGLLVNLYP